MILQAPVTAAASRRAECLKRPDGKTCGGRWDCSSQDPCGKAYASGDDTLRGIIRLEPKGRLPQRLGLPIPANSNSAPSMCIAG
jgi:hypothetical protein